MDCQSEYAGNHAIRFQKSQAQSFHRTHGPRQLAHLQTLSSLQKNRRRTHQAIAYVGRQGMTTLCCFAFSDVPSRQNFSTPSDAFMKWSQFFTSVVGRKIVMALTGLFL